MTSQNSELDRLVELLEGHAPEDGVHHSPIKNFGAMRMSKPHAKIRSFYDPVLLIVGQGEKHCYVGDQRYRHSAGQLLTLFLPMPVETEIVEAR